MYFSNFAGITPNEKVKLNQTDLIFKE